MSVQVSNLSKIYGQQKAVNQINFSAKPGEILGFLGPNGAGKTTTMKMLCCFTSPSSGKASVCGFDVEQNPMEVKTRIGYLPEHNPLYKEMYVREYLNFVSRIHHLKNKKERIEEMIERTGLQKEQHKKISALSKGYRQRVGLAQAMIHDPEVLILDEPTSGLDPNQLIEIRQLIKSLGREKTVIFSTHIMQEVQALCDRVIIINNGEIVANDPISQLSNRVRGDQIIRVEFDKIIDQSLLEKLTGVLAVKAESEHTYTLVGSRDLDLRVNLFDFAVNQKIRILEMNRDEVSVEDVFQKLTKNKKA